MKLFCRNNWFVISHHVSQFFLVLALGVGIYLKWSLTNDSITLVIIISSIIAVLGAVILLRLFPKKQIGYCLFGLWVGYITSLISFSSIKSSEENILLPYMNIFFVISVFFHFISELLKILCNFSISYNEHYYIMFVSAGFSIIPIVTGDQYINVLFLLIALLAIKLLLKLKSYLGIVNLIVFMILTVLDVFSRFPNNFIQWNALLTFFANIIISPILSLFLAKEGALDTWEIKVFRKTYLRNLFILCLIPIETFMFVSNLILIRFHKEWFIVLPMYLFFGLVWISFHAILLTICCILSSKITECQRFHDSLENDGRNLNQIMAAKGLRYISLVSHNLLNICLVTTVILYIISWQTRTTMTIANFLLILPLESFVVSLTYQLSTQLGGTCIGYALVVPIYSGR